MKEERARESLVRWVLRALARLAVELLLFLTSVSCRYLKSSASRSLNLYTIVTALSEDEVHMHISLDKLTFFE
ncbi:uncharacterized protein F4807DRAFT_433201 [Annulohypoxylon truncatum]|uniref:uncharacterized protein n=1 Tax=Annulohypoxylon truncatum TaxID=327061 RepID=UPI002007A97E|nr:uncharacterized protein F4807DRAFT_433201 [Annulohypoxylon truncatum]KAI1208104.1 hypothetical protein F4807DRAFT_433201 [Annulohypoxylon truncatum]